MSQFLVIIIAEQRKIAKNIKEEVSYEKH